MQFPFSLFGDFLAEFQKYLADRISRPAYWALGLVVVALGIIASYLTGWMALLHTWNSADTSLKVVLGSTALVMLLLLAYLLGQMQGIVERWFQGDWPRRWRRSALERHRAAWLAHQHNLQALGDLYGSLYEACKAITHWEAQQAAGNPSAHRAASISSPQAITGQIKKLDTEYRDGEQWLRRLRDGVMAGDIPPHGNELEEAFLLLENLPASTDDENRASWLQQVNDYRNGWIRLLSEAYKEIEYRIDQQKKSFSLYYPSTIERVAPTRIGNVFHAVDAYCDDLYGLDIALVLPRLQGVMEDSTRDQLTKAHDQLELFEWLSLGSIMTGICGTLLASQAQHYLLAVLLWLLVLPVPRFILYPVAVRAALDYATALRLAVDRERGKILKMAGFALSSPTNQQQEKTCWNQIQQWWAYGTPPGEYTLIMEGTDGDTGQKKT